MKSHEEGETCCFTPFAASGLFFTSKSKTQSQNRNNLKVSHHQLNKYNSHKNVKLTTHDKSTQCFIS
jgi:hypothetical protein